MRIKDVNGKERDISISLGKGAIITVYDTDTGEPLYSEVILETGEGCSVMKSPDFKRSNELDDLLIKTKREGLFLGIIQATSGALFCHVHPNSGINKLMLDMGGKLEVVDIKGKNWNKYVFPLEKVFNVTSGVMTK